MTNEWIDWNDSRIRTPLRTTGCYNFLNNNYTSSYSNKIAGMGLKMHSVMKHQQLKVRGKFP